MMDRLKKVVLRRLMFAAALFILLGQTVVRHAYAAEVTYVAVIDTPLDYNDPTLKGLIDFETLKKNNGFNGNPEILSWYEINNRGFREAVSKSGLNAQTYPIALLRFQTGEIGKWAARNSDAPNERKTREFYKTRRDPSPIVPLLHGTHVTGILTKNLENVRVVNFPMLDLNRMMEHLFVRPFTDISHLRMQVKEYFRTISLVLHEKNVKIVNLSWELALERVGEAFDKMLSSGSIGSANRGTALSLKDNMKKMLQEEFDYFIDDNPQALFTFAANNNAKDLSVDDSGLRIQRPNSVTVGALDTMGKPIVFTNYSSLYVDLLAPGDLISGPAAGIPGTEIVLSGTSMAAPYLGNAATALVQSFGGSLSGAELKEKIIELKTESKHEGFSVNGRILVTENCSSKMELTDAP